jgi:hypothetical protein
MVKDRANFEKMFDYNQRNATQKGWLDTWFKSKVQDTATADSSLNIKTSLSSLSDNALGMLTPTAEQTTAINSDPELFARYTTAKKNQAILDKIYNSFPEKDETKIDGLDKLPGNIQNEITAAKDAWNVENDKLTQIKTKLDDKEEEIRAEMSGK